MCRGLTSSPAFPKAFRTLNAATSPGVKTVSLLTATCIVIANMVGTGVFTSLGFQVGGLPSGFAIVVLWIVGGIAALCGAVAYAELGAALPQSGGEYHFTSKIYGPTVGFLSGWLSITVGFAAPVAAAAMALGGYCHEVLPVVPPMPLAIGTVLLITLVHLGGVRIGSWFQNAATAFKVALILVFIVAGAFFAQDPQPVTFAPQPGDLGLILSAPFAISLVYVMYAYSGWNASTYIIGEIHNPSRNVFLSVALGTGLVMALYVALNMVFFRAASIPEMTFKKEVGLIAGRHIFGDAGGQVMAGLICLGLVSTISAMTWVGPRVAQRMGQDLPPLRLLARTNTAGTPAVALVFQAILALVLVVTATFDAVINYVQFSLTLSSTVTVAGLFVLRWRQPALPRPYRAWGYPVTPLIFLAISGWMLTYMLLEERSRNPSLLGLTTILIGLVVYAFLRKSAAPMNPNGTA